MRRKVVLDTNLLVLLVVGSASRAYIARHKRLEGYGTDDFDLLGRLIAFSAGIVVTPNILSEASNLLRQIKEPMRTQLGEVLRRIVREVQIEELYIPSRDAVGREEFLWLGLADCVALESARNGLVILSADHHLCRAGQQAGYQVVNFNHERGL